MSIRLSKIDAVRLTAQSSDDTHPLTHKPRQVLRRSKTSARLIAGRGEVRNARAARNPRIAYSVKCAIFRVMKWIVASVSGLVLGNNQSTSGPIMREVFEAEKLFEEAKDMNASQIISGR